ncbi:MAG: hypothetical protein Q9162_002211 [Coniocarpon cinnabarinum]
MANYNGSKRSGLQIYAIFVAICFVVFTISYHFQYPQGASRQLHSGDRDALQEQHPDHPIDSRLLTGHAIAPKLGNETAKAELGRAAWKLLHTTFARFPDKPTDEEKAALKSYVHLFQRLYPCGECAGHFGHILDKYPPQVSSRSAAAAWGCLVHNEVNKSLSKDLFDCSEIGDFYDCGCADDEKGEHSTDKTEKKAHQAHGSVMADDEKLLANERDN